jgi:signal peptidase I
MEEERARRGVKLFVRDVAVILLAALLVSFLVKTFLIRSFYIPSESMEQTLIRNDRIIVNQLVPGLMEIERGDVVVFTDPGGWIDQQPQAEQDGVGAVLEQILSVTGLTAPDSDDHLIKRVIGLPGDTVTCCDEVGQMIVNGVSLDEPYVTVPPGSTQATENEFTVTVPDDSLFVMGDNRYVSADSAYHYTRNDPAWAVPIDDVVGRAVLISWPVDRWSWLDNYPLVFDGVEEAGSSSALARDEESAE